MNAGIYGLTSQEALGPYPLLGSPRPVPTINARAFDADAGRYIDAVEAADGQRLEPAVAAAINSFVVGCKAANIWDAIVDCCILCGARTLAGCLVPLKGAAPTNVNFVSGDYARGGASPGLKGNGSSKYLKSNRFADYFNQNNVHLSVFITDIGTLGATAQYIGSTTIALLYIGNLKIRARVSFNAVDSATNLRAVGLIGASRNAPAAYQALGNNNQETITGTSTANAARTLAVLARNGNGVEGSIDIYSDGRAAMYTIGSDINIGQLSILSESLVAAIKAAIP